MTTPRGRFTDRSTADVLDEDPAVSADQLAVPGADLATEVLDAARDAADRERGRVATPPPAVSRETELADGLPAVIDVWLEEFTIGEMDTVEQWVRQSEYGRLTVMTWLAARKLTGADVPIETVANLPAGRMRVHKEGTATSVPLPTA